MGQGSGPSISREVPYLMTGPSSRRPAEPDHTMLHCSVIGCASCVGPGTLVATSRQVLGCASQGRTTTQAPRHLLRLRLYFPRPAFLSLMFRVRASVHSMSDSAARSSARPHWPSLRSHWPSPQPHLRSASKSSWMELPPPPPPGPPGGASDRCATGGSRVNSASDSAAWA